MTKSNEYEIYLHIGINLFEISVFSNLDLKNLYNEKLVVNNSQNNIDIVKLINFLDKNIFKIEKTLNFFIKSINVIFEDKNFLEINLSSKHYCDKKIINKNDKLILLNNLKNDIIKNYSDLSIIHFLIIKYLIDNNETNFFINEVACEFFCLDVKFICFNKKSFSNIENILKKNYQITLNKIISQSYINNFMKDNNYKLNTCELAFKISKGLNQNEVFIEAKSIEKLGFFERFFHIFN